MKSEALLIDCMEYMKTVPDKYFDLAVVDPPYGINAPNMAMGSNPNRSGRDERGEIQYGAVSVAQRLKKGRLNQGSGKLKNRVLNTMNCDWDMVKPSAEYFQELFRISENQIIWGGNYFDLPPTRGIICWNKLQPWENFSQWEMAWTSFDRPAMMFSYSNNRGANAEKKIHPTQKPVKLYQWIYGKLLPSGGKVFDSHLGSGSNRIAADKAGNIDFVGCEIDPDYFHAQEKRFKDYKSQLTMQFQ